MREHPPDPEPEQEQRGCRRQDVSALVARHRPFAALLRPLVGTLEPFPGHIAVHTGQAVIDGHAEIGIQTGLEI